MLTGYDECHPPPHQPPDDVCRGNIDARAGDIHLHISPGTRQLFETDLAKINKIHHAKFKHSLLSFVHM